MSKNISLLTYNVNGIRAAMNKGLVDWIRQHPFDIIMFQELKAQEGQFDVTEFEKLGYHHHWFPAQKKGYSGVGILSRLQPDNIVKGIGIEEYDFEGRIIRMDVGDLTVIDTYFPNGITGAVRQAFKMKFLDDYFSFLNTLRKTRPNIILSGDYNICHKDIDIYDPVSNQNVSGFLPEEREWLTKFFESGWIDTFRYFNQSPEQYTWWSPFRQARSRNRGWRIDYHNATEPLEDRLVSTRLIPEAMHSDHCPVLLEIKA